MPSNRIVPVFENRQDQGDGISSDEEGDPMEEDPSQEDSDDSTFALGLTVERQLEEEKRKLILKVNRYRSQIQPDQMEEDIDQSEHEGQEDGEDEDEDPMEEEPSDEEDPELDPLEKKRLERKRNSIVKGWLENEPARINTFKLWLCKDIEDIAKSLIRIHNTGVEAHREKDFQYFLSEYATALGLLQFYEIQGRWVDLPFKEISTLWFWLDGFMRGDWGALGGLRKIGLILT